MANRITARRKGDQRLGLDDTKKLLALFLANNPASKLEVSKRFHDRLAIRDPWGDGSIEIVLPEKSGTGLVEALNNVVLPERFTAIWHVDTKRLEIIYTPYPADEADRSFKFHHKNEVYECIFTDSSSRLLLFAEYYFPVGTSETDYRNLNPFSDYVLEGKDERRPGRSRKILDGRPLSFWIEGLKDWNTDIVLDLALHLNFYMSYYDTQSAQILLHSPSSETTAMQPEDRFREGTFPENINARPIEENLLHFWRASKEDSDPIRAFLNNYLILEYAAFFYIEESVKRNVRRCLVDPNANGNFELWTQRILEAIGEKMHDNIRVQHVLKNCVDPKLLWQQFANNLDFFCQTVRFDGGFVLEPMFTKGATEAHFSINWESGFENKIRGIRNALSHGKEQRTLATISPTTKNFRLLQQWVPVISVAAREVMVYRELT